MPRSLRGRRSEEMTNGILSLHEGQKYLLSPRGVIAIKVHLNEQISQAGKMEG